MASPGQRHGGRFLKSAEGSGGIVVADIQEHLKKRKRSRPDPGYTPMKTVGRAKSEKMLFSIPEQSGGFSGRTKWHILPPGRGTKVQPIISPPIPVHQPGIKTTTSSSPTEKVPYHGRANIPPPPKTPPPVLAHRVRNPHSEDEPPKIAISKSLSSVTMEPSSEKRGISCSLSVEVKRSSSNHSEVEYEINDTIPTSGSVGSGRVKGLAKLFTAREEVAKKPDHLTKASSEPKDIGLGSPVHRAGGRREGSVPPADSLGRGGRPREGSLPPGDSLGRGGRPREGSVPPGDSLGRGRRLPGGSTSSESEFTSSTDSTRSYQNIFDDEAFARFDKRPKKSDSGKRDKKPKPLPRNSVSSLTLKSTAVKGSGDSVSRQEATAAQGSPLEEEYDHPPVQTPVVTVNRQLVDLEAEIDLLVDITNLPSRLSQFSPSPEVPDQSTGAPTRKAELSKTKSYNPGGSMPISRRNSPQVKKELRKGVCSDGDQEASETEDDYIPMRSIAHSELTASLQKHSPSSSPPDDPRSSTYYLKILPNDPPSQLTANNQNNDSPKSPGDTYVKMGTLKSGVTAAEVELTKAKGEPERHTRGKQLSHSLGRTQGLAINSNSRFRPVKYSEVTLPEKEVNGTSATASHQGSHTEKSTPPRPSEGRRPLQYNEVFLREKSPDSEAQSLTPIQTAAVPAPSEKIGQGEENAKFRDRPLPARPPENPYYNTSQDATLSPITTVPKARAVWHEYVEIDEDEIEKMASAISEDTQTGSPQPQRHSQPESKMIRVIEGPPKVPDRPDNLDSLLDDSTGDYSYAAIPGQTLFGFQWMKFHARNMAERSPPPPAPIPSPERRSNSTPALTVNSPKVVRKDTPPRGVDSTSSAIRPPTPPPKTESLLREVSLIPPYTNGKPSLYNCSPRANFRKMSAPEVLSLSTALPRGRQPQSRLPDITAESKQYSKMFGRRKRTPPARPKHPPRISHQKLQAAKPLNYQGTSPGIPGTRGTKKTATPRPRAHQQVSRQRSHSFGEVPIKRTPLRQSKSYNPANPHAPTRDAPDLPPRIQWRKRSMVRSKIDRRSLAIIMQNKEAISQQLEKTSEVERSQRSEEAGDSSVARSLGDILIELDTLLRHKLYTEEDLILAIEQQLKIKLQTVKDCGQAESPPPGESPKTGPESSRESSSRVDVTDQDVEDVVSYMRSHSSELLSEVESPKSILKPRSETVLILDDDSSSDSRERSESPVDHDHTPKDVTRTRSTSSPLLLDIPSMRDGRSHSTGNHGLRRVNARRRPSAQVDDCLTNTNASTFCNGIGLFTHAGGTLMNASSGVEIEIPEGAIPKGKKQRVWFDVIQPVYDFEKEEDERTQSLTQSHQFTASGLESSLQLQSHLRDKQERWIQLSPIVLVGPCDATFQKPIKVKIPHCLPYRNNSWHMHMLARGQNSKSEDWLELPNSSGLIIPARKHKSKMFQSTTYQMHLHYAIVRTRQLGSFKLIGTPVGKGAYSAKRMVASVYMRQEESDAEESVGVEVFMTNSIFDQVQALHKLLLGSRRYCLEMNIPVLCFGDGRDMELTLANDTNSNIPLATETISFGEFWRLKEIGQPRVLFTVDKKALDSSRTLTLRIQQAGAKLSHETNFIIP